MSQLLVSVLMTAYNREKYIIEAIESVLSSEYTNFELIITDNCSTDNTYEIAKKYELKDGRVRVFRNSENIGQFRNRNFAASLAKGAYLKYLDSDDILYPYGLSILMKAAKQFPEAGLIASTEYAESSPFPVLIQPREAFYRYYLAKGFPVAGPSDTLIKNDAFKEVNGFSVSSFAGTDTELTLKIASIYPIAVAEPGVSWYRRHDDQEINVAFKGYDYELHSYSCYSALLLTGKCPLPEEERRLALKRLRKNNIRQLMRYAFRFKMSLSRKIYTNLRPSFSEIVMSIINK